MRSHVRVRAAATAGLLAAATGGCTFVGGDGGGTYTLTAYFTKGISLYEGGDVRVLGLPAGEVKEVAVEGTRVRVELAIRNDIPVPADVEATIVPMSLIGERYVQLFPAWVQGDERAGDGDVLDLDRTSVPVEPDEALAALKEFLDSLDPDATGRLVKNLADDLDGNGERLNRALAGLADVASTFAEKDDELVSIIEHFDEFTATVRTREAQLGEVMDAFATTTSVLARERRDIERLVKALGRLSIDGVALVSEHGARLEHDIEVLTRTLQSASAHIDGVRQLLDATPLLVAGPGFDGKRGLAGAWDPKHHDIDLRNSSSPTVGQMLDAIGMPTPVVCIPLDVECAPPGDTPTSAPSDASGATPAAPPTIETPDRSAPAVASATPAASGRAVERPRRERAPAEIGQAGWLRRLARAIGDVVA